MSILTIEDAKVCAACDLKKSIKDFSASSTICKPCKVLRTKDWWNSLPVEVRREREKWNGIYKRYRLRKDEYEAMTADGCEVCGTMDSLCIDHDHDCCSGKYTCGNCVRGVLCKRHNTAESLLTVDELKALLKYKQKGVNNV